MDNLKKIKLLEQKKNKLVERHKKLILNRKMQIGKVFEKLNFLHLSNDDIKKILQLAVEQKIIKSS